MSYIIELADNALDSHPDTVIVCGGGVNKMGLNQLQQLSGWYALVNFPTRGKSCLDNVLTNRKDLWQLFSFGYANQDWPSCQRDLSLNLFAPRS